MAQNQITQESLEQFTKRHLRTYAMMSTFYFTIGNSIINRLFEKYIFNTFCYFEEYKLIRRHNLSKSILKNPRLIFTDDATNQLFALCPNDCWKGILKMEFEEYKSKAPLELKQLFRLSHLTFGQLQKSFVHGMFHSEMINQSKHIKKLIEEVYVELHTNL